MSLMGHRTLPMRPAFRHFKTMVNPSIVSVLSAQRCERKIRNSPLRDLTAPKDGSSL